MRRAGGGYGAVVAAIATLRAAEGTLLGVRTVALMLMGGLSNTAGMRGCSCGRQRQRNKSSDEREQQQQSGGRAMHRSNQVCFVNQVPRIRFPTWGKHRTESRTGASRAAYVSAYVLRQALPLILAHHQRTPTNRKRQSLKNSGGLPSKAWPTNWRIHPSANSASA